MTLRRLVRNIHQKGSQVYAVVEEINLGFATVRIADRGARLTSLPVVGGTVTIGQRVIVDYSAGTPPVVRPITLEAVQPAPLPAAEPAENIFTPYGDHGCRVYYSSGTALACSNGTWVTIPWTHAEYQTDPFWDSGAATEIVLPGRGIYLFIGDIAWSASDDHWAEYEYTPISGAPGSVWVSEDIMAIQEPFEILLESTLEGEIGYAMDFPIDSKATEYKYMQIMTTYFAQGEDTIVMKIKQSTLLSSMNAVQVTEGGLIIAPRLTVQWMGDPGL